MQTVFPETVVDKAEEGKADADGEAAIPKNTSLP